jgi:hypothetical protein
MPNLASIVMAAWLFVHAQFGLSGVPIPVVIETGHGYAYSEIYSSITVPYGWTATCYNQSQLVFYIAEYFNSQLNGNQRKSEEKLLEIKDKWECVK